MVHFYVLSFFKKGDTIQGVTLFKGEYYLRKYGLLDILIQVDKLIDISKKFPSLLHAYSILHLDLSLSFYIHTWFKNQLPIVWFEIKLTHKWPFYDHFCPLFCHLYIYLSQNWGSDGQFDMHNRSKFWLVENLWHKKQIFPFPKFCDFVQKH